ncbi:solute carrier family 22 member 5-like [Clupea harengus]|uniref:Solute carrier family 22 member 5-like n=1 Tax=Clupea harengus TaxID=7950 RepID=A0A6P8FXX4_CLUHA|nr:solute carrier family 22 member 5-like [Clupea harengus]
MKTQGGYYDEQTLFLGEWGPFQRIVFFLLCCSIIPNGFTGLSIVFTGDTPSHHCHIPAHYNITVQWRNVCIPLEEYGGTIRLGRCTRYRLDLIKSYSDKGYEPTWNVNVSEMQQEVCKDGWEYDRQQYISTIVSEWDLVCADDWKTPVTPSVFFFGVLTGSFVSGPISDRFGRKIVLFSTMAVQTIFTLIQVFSPSWLWFCALYFIVGMGQISNYVAAFILGMEIMSPSVRILFGTLGVSLFFVFGYMLLPLTAYLIRDWRMLQLALTVPGFLCIPLWWFIPESPRWLLSQGRVAEAEAILRDAARRNGVTAPEVIFEPVQQANQAEKMESHNICDLVKTNSIRCITIVLCVVWITLTIGYFALSLNTPNLNGDSYLNCFLSAAIELPACTAAWLMYRYWPRRMSLFLTLFQAGAVLLLIHLIPQHMSSIAITLEMLGKFGVAAATDIVYAVTAELYPTVLRNTALGTCSMASRVGSISAPYFLYLGNYYKSLPYILIGTLSVLSAFLSLLLPESLGMPLPESINHMQTISCCKRSERSKTYHLTSDKGDEDRPVETM